MLVGGGLIETFVRRPVLSSVISLLIVIAGAAAILGAEVRELPDVDQPVVSVRTSYPGAAPEVVDAEVTSVIEGAVAQVDGVISISSDSRYQRSNVTIEFSNSVDINVAATDVQNAVAGELRDLPEEVEPPEVVKADNDSSPVMRLYVAAPGLSDGDIADLVEDVILPRIQAVEGVAEAYSYGDRKQLLRVRILPTTLASRGLSVGDVAELLRSAGQSAPSGRLRSSNQDLLIRAEAQADSPEKLGDLRFANGVRLRDVAVVEWGLQDQATTARVNGAPGVGIAVVRQAQSNTVAVAEGVYRAVEELNESLPANVEVDVTVDDAVFIRRAISEVTQSLLFATLIVSIVIFAFLRSARATIVPIVAIPVSLLGTVAALYLAGFSINLITLLAFVMATGLVVDDAIVVTENIERKRSEGLGKRAAAILGAKEIIFAVLSTTATLAAVFIPISFLPGQAGRLFSEFGFTLAFAVCVSSFVALTLCPMLSVKFAKEKAPAAANEGAVNDGFDRVRGSYIAIVKALLARPVIPFVASMAFAVGAVFVFAGLPRELTPTEDRGGIFMIVNVQDGANLAYLDEKVREIEARLAPFVEDGEATNVISINGARDQIRSFVILKLEDWSERKTPQIEFEKALRQITSEIPGVTVFVRGGNSLGIRGAGQGLQFAVAGEDYVATADAAEEIAAQLQQNPLFTFVRLNFSTSQPQIDIEIDREKAALLGANVADITTAINVMADEFRAGRVFIGDDAIDIMLSAGGDPVDDPTDLRNVFVRTGDGSFVPLSSVATVSETAVASALSREQRRRAVPVTASLAPGARLGDAVAALQEVADETLPSGMSTILLGEARLLRDADQSTNLVFGFAALIVFLVLSAQFESVISSLIIMITVPFGLAAASYAIFLLGGSINYYSQIGLVLLIGIMAKNGILIVEFANQLRDGGASVRDAILGACSLRLRPVAMTAISTLFGALPLILGAGAGAESRAALGWVIVGGLGFATVFTLFLTPIAYDLLARFSKPRAAEERKVSDELAAAR
ncbi:MAG: MMPL family transporter [Alphaproteobacteria bacterium]|nr:MMPL family transporter [Alphaproteobacteria bacterium]